MKAQSSIENLVILGAFMALLVPAAFFMLSLTSKHLKTASYEDARSSLYKIKWALEDDYAHCPSKEVFPVRLGKEVNGIQFINEDNTWFIVANATYGQIVLPISIKNNVVYINPSGLDQAKGSFFVSVECEKNLNNFIFSVNKEGGW